RMRNDIVNIHINPKRYCNVFFEDVWISINFLFRHDTSDRMLPNTGMYIQ
ncbi:MAG: hypothetical protein UT26_C0021G0001, partial [Microgenomates group bacterium GW2011_GWC1_39_12]